MKTELDLQIKPNTHFSLNKVLEDKGNTELYTINMTLSRPNIERLRGYKWDYSPFITVDRLAVVDDHDLSLLKELIEIISIGNGYKPINTHVINVSAIENIICNNWPTVEVYFDQLPLLENGETNYWYVATSKADNRFNIDDYVMSLNNYTGDQSWHVSDITEDDKQHVVYEFTNTYDDLYY